MTSYEQYSEHTIPGDAVVVHIHRDGASLVGDVHRRLAIIEGSVSVEVNAGPMAVPAALIQAGEILTAMGHRSGTLLGVNSANCNSR
jgi:hypothetical protein